MDSKQKFIKNQYWKKKYQPRNPNKVKNVAVKTNSKETVNNDESSESEEELKLKQPVPKEGWFLEEELVSSDSDTGDLETVQKYLKSKPESEHDSDYEYEQSCSNSFKGNLHVVKSKNLNENIELKKPIDNSAELKKTIPKNDSQDEFDDLISQLKNKTRFNVSKNEKKTVTLSPEEEELDFLLSLKEPLHTGPIKPHKSFNNDRSLPSLKTKSIADEKNKTPDLEKWLDSVLDS